MSGSRSSIKYSAFDVKLGIIKDSEYKKYYTLYRKFLMKISPFTFGSNNMRNYLQNRILADINRDKQRNGEPLVSLHDVFTEESIEVAVELPQAIAIVGFDPSLKKQPLFI